MAERVGTVDKTTVKLPIVRLTTEDLFARWWRDDSLQLLHRSRLSKVRSRQRQLSSGDGAGQVLQSRRPATNPVAGPRGRDGGRNSLRGYC
jgi:hypothetical protein